MIWHAVMLGQKSPVDCQCRILEKGERVNTLYDWYEVFHGPHSALREHILHKIYLLVHCACPKSGLATITGAANL